VWASLLLGGLSLGMTVVARRHDGTTARRHDGTMARRLGKGPS
jgi:hypothetical protein